MTRRSIPLLIAAAWLFAGLAAPNDAHADFSSFSQVGTDPSGDDTYGDDHFRFYSFFDNEFITGPLGIPLGWIDLLALDGSHDDSEVRLRLRLADIPAPGEDADAVAGGEDPRKLVDLATGTIRYAVQFKISTTTYIATVDVEFVAGVPVLVQQGHWGQSDRQSGFTNVDFEVELDPAADTVTFTIQRSDVGGPPDGINLVNVIASTWSSEIPSGNPVTGESNSPVNPWNTILFGEYSLFAVNDWLPDCRKSGEDSCSELTYELTAGS